MDMRTVSRTHADGKITVKKYEPAAYEEPGEGPALVRIHVEEDFSGDIDGSGVAEFLQTSLSESEASFVGVERVTGKVGGRSGTFVFQDEGTRRHNRQGDRDRPRDQRRSRRRQSPEYAGSGRDRRCADRRQRRRGDRGRRRRQQALGVRGAGRGGYRSSWQLGHPRQQRRDRAREVVRGGQRRSSTLPSKRKGVLPTAASSRSSG
jgi:Protein of unknown function (DUF3224)